MQSESLIKQKVRDFILELEGPEDQSGGSGHSSHIIIEIEEIRIEKNPNENSSYKYAAHVRFSKTIETEFTYFPDNPPIMEEFAQIIYIDENLAIKGFADKKMVSSNVEIDRYLGDVDPW